MHQFIETGAGPAVWSVPGATSVDLAYAVTTSSTSPSLVVPDGRCGLAVVEGQVWWMGPMTAPWRPDRSGVEVVGVRLALSAGRAVAGQSLATWRDTRAPVEALWGEQAASELASQLARAHCAATTSAALVSMIERRASLAAGRAEARRLAGLVASGGSVAEISAKLCVTPRQLHRQCVDAFGLPPSVLQRIQRVHRAARARHARRQLTLAELAVESGYTDQSHMAREVRTLTGQSTRQAFG
jgi:AraC-like DNA-binding protein